MDVKHEIELLIGHLPQDGVAQDPGIGDQDVKAPELGDGPVDQRVRHGGRTDRGHVRDGPAARGGDHGRRRVGGGLIGVVDDDGGAGVGQGLDVGEPEAAAASGDDGDLAGQVHAIPFLGGRQRGSWIRVRGVGRPGREARQN